MRLFSRDYQNLLAVGVKSSMSCNKLQKTDTRSKYSISSSRKLNSVSNIKQNILNILNKNEKMYVNQRNLTVERVHYEIGWGVSQGNKIHIQENMDRRQTGEKVLLYHNTRYWTHIRNKNS